MWTTPYNFRADRNEIRRIARILGKHVQDDWMRVNWPVPRPFSGELLLKKVAGRDEERPAYLLSLHRDSDGKCDFSSLDLYDLANDIAEYANADVKVDGSCFGSLLQK